MAANLARPFGIPEWMSICGYPIRTGQIARNVVYPFSSLTKDQRTTLKSAFMLTCTAIAAAWAVKTGQNWAMTLGAPIAAFIVSHIAVTWNTLANRFKNFDRQKGDIDTIIKNIRDHHADHLADLKKLTNNFLDDNFKPKKGANPNWPSILLPQLKGFCTDNKIRVIQPATQSNRGR